jgi:hypothetical protein
VSFEGKVKERKSEMEKSVYINEELGIIAEQTWEDIPVESLRELEDDGGDEFFQRAFMSGKFRELDRNFDIRAVGSLVVSRRAGGLNFIIDGRHRTRLCKKHGVESVHCQVLTELTRKDEARLFICYNNRGQPKAIELYRSKRIAGDPLTVEVHEACEEAGWIVNKSGGVPNTTRAVGTLYNCYNRAPKGANKKAWLAMLLRTIARAWPDDPKNGESAVIGGMHEFWKHVAMTNERMSRLIAKLSLTTVAHLLMRTGQLRLILGTTTPYVFAAAMLDEYNKNLSEKVKLRFPDQVNE